MKKNRNEYEMVRVDQIIKKVFVSIPKQFKFAFVSAFIFGLLAHMYMLTNKLPNMDDLYSIDGFGATFKVGRWFLWVVGAIAYHLNLVYSMPWFNGLVTILLLACSAGVVAVLLDLNSNISNVILGAALVTFPSWTATFFYMFTAPYYALAVLLAVLSVFFTVKYKKGYIIAVPLLACSMGIYQAYLPFVATLYVVLLFQSLYDEDKNYKDILRNSLFYLINLIASVIVYFVILRLSLVITNQSLNAYKGLDTIGEFSLGRIQEIIKNIFINFFGIFINNNLEISYNLITKGMYFILYVVVFLLVMHLITNLYKKKDYMKSIETFVLLIMYILAINSIYIMCSDGIYALMYFSYVFLLIFPLVLLDKNIAKCGSNKGNCITEWIVSFVLLCGIGSYCQYASAEYLSIELSVEQAKSYYTTLITQIKSVEGYTDSCKVALVGNNVTDSTFYRNDVMNKFDMSGRDRTIVEAYSRENFLKYYCGFSAEYVSIEQLPEDKINRMPIYPTDGSVQMIDDVVVVKLAEN